jgi:hypothetical protein
MRLIMKDLEEKRRCTPHSRALARKEREEIEERKKKKEIKKEKKERNKESAKERRGGGVLLVTKRGVFLNTIRFIQLARRSYGSLAACSLPSS